MVLIILHCWTVEPSHGAMTTASSACAVMHIFVDPWTMVLSCEDRNINNQNHKADSIVSHGFVVQPLLVAAQRVASMLHDWPVDR